MKILLGKAGFRLSVVTVWDFSLCGTLMTDLVKKESEHFHGANMKNLFIYMKELIERYI